MKALIVIDHPTIRITQCRRIGIGHDHRIGRSRSAEYARYIDADPELLEMLALAKRIIDRVDRSVAGKKGAQPPAWKDAA